VTDILTRDEVVSKHALWLLRSERNDVTDPIHDSVFASHLAALTEIERLREQVNAAYDERNQVVLFAAALASNQWTPVWVSRDPSEPDWPVLGIGLEDEGQVTWHLPPGTDTSIAYSRPQPWDGHTTEEKYARVRAFVASIAGIDAGIRVAANDSQTRSDRSTPNGPTT
jgi:hypothetical protein